MDYSPSPMGGGKRAPPPPIRIAPSSYTPSNSYYGPASRRGSASTLLYDMPSASPRKTEYNSNANRHSHSRILSSPPPTEELLYSIPTPGSPPVRVSRSTTPRVNSPRDRRSNLPQSPPPPPARPRGSSLPPEPTQKELDDFEALCRAFFFTQDENAKLSMEAVMSRVPQYHQAKYTRLQANVRREFHLTQSLRKLSEFRAHLSSVQPGCSLSPAARASPSGPLARRERAEKFQTFIEAQCGSAGTQNFFIGLYTVMRLQTLPPSIGGTGEARIEWEMDDAVFMESGGNQFMVDAIDTMKGALGFEERPLNNRPLPSRSFRHRPSRSSPTNILLSSRDRGENPLPSEVAGARPARGRARAPSDPFLDPTRGSPSMHAALSMPPPTPEESATDLESLGPSTPLDDRGPEIPPLVSLSTQYSATTFSMDVEAFLNEPQLRVWIFPPYITNPELHKLIAMLPVSITNQTVPRFKPLAKGKQRKGRRKGADIDLEGEGNPMQLGSGADTTGADANFVNERGEIRKGTGRMWMGDLMRLPGWRGSLWDTIRDWFRHLFS